LAHNFETLNEHQLQSTERCEIAELLIKSQAWDNFMALKFPTFSRCGEAHLVIYNEMHAASHFKVWDIGHIETLLIDALSGKSRIAMKYHIEYMLTKRLSIGIIVKGALSTTLLLGTCFAHGNWISCLKERI